MGRRTGSKNDYLNDDLKAVISFAASKGGAFHTHDFLDGFPGFQRAWKYSALHQLVLRGFLNYLGRAGCQGGFYELTNKQLIGTMLHSG